MFTFTLKQNFRASGTEVTITNETHTVALVSPYVIKLVEVPLRNTPSTVSIPGYTESSSQNPALGFFFVNYSIGYITFNATAVGQVVSVSYKGRGSIVDAIDVDDIQDLLGPLLNPDGTFADGIVRPVNISTNPSDAFTFPNTVLATNGLLAPSLTALPGSGNSVDILANDNVGADGGALTLAAGDVLSGDGNGGDVIISIGAGSGTGTPGLLRFQLGGIDVATSTVDGNFRLLTNTAVFLGRFTQSQEDVLVASLGAGDGGCTWFNVDQEQFLGWSGSAVVVLG